MTNNEDFPGFTLEGPLGCITCYKQSNDNTYVTFFEEYVPYFQYPTINKRGIWKTELEAMADAKICVGLEDFDLKNLKENLD